MQLNCPDLEPLKTEQTTRSWCRLMSAGRRLNLGDLPAIKDCKTRADITIFPCLLRTFTKRIMFSPGRPSSELCGYPSPCRSLTMREGREPRWAGEAAWCIVGWQWRLTDAWSGWLITGYLSPPLYISVDIYVCLYLHFSEFLKQRGTSRG